VSSDHTSPTEVNHVFFEFSDNAEYLSESSGSDLEAEIEVGNLDDLRSEGEFSINNESDNSERKSSNSELHSRSMKLEHTTLLLLSNSEVSSSKSSKI
jgi:hypothetical protein